MKNYKGKAYLKFASTNEIPVTLSVPIVILEDFQKPEFTKLIEHFCNFKRTNKDLSGKLLIILLKTDILFNNSCKFYNVTDEERVECIKKLLRLDHLNHEEYEHVGKSIKNNADRFQIPLEPLEATNVL